MNDLEVNAVNDSPIVADTNDAPPTEVSAKENQHVNRIISEDRYRFMPGSKLLSETGNEKSRIGDDNKRKANPFIAEAEALLAKHCPLALTFDIRPIHPPFFREFSYTDMMYGVLVNTMSGEINLRLRRIAAETDTDHQFPIEKAGDKYEMQSDSTKPKYRKVIFLPGLNTTEFINESTLMELALDPEWVVKPHPVSGDGMIADCIAVFGADRVLNRHTSGHDILENAEEIACTAASELYLKAVLMEKPVMNITNYARQHVLSYGSFVAVLEEYRKKGADLAELKRRLNNMLMSDYSGFILESNGTRRNTKIMETYFSKAMELREPWRMETPQRLVVSDLSLAHWRNGPKK